LDIVQVFAVKGILIWLSNRWTGFKNFSKRLFDVLEIFAEAEGYVSKGLGASMLNLSKAPL
jgi:hypothetical protein